MHSSYFLGSWWARKVRCLNYTFDLCTTTAIQLPCFHGGKCDYMKETSIGKYNHGSGNLFSFWMMLLCKWSEVDRLVYITIIPQMNVKELMKAVLAIRHLKFKYILKDVCLKIFIRHHYKTLIFKKGFSNHWSPNGLKRALWHDLLSWMRKHV